MEKNIRESLAFHKDGKIYIINDTFEIPKEIENMPEEEMERRILLMENVGRKEGKDLPDPKPLLAI